MSSEVAARNSIKAASFPAGTQTLALERKLVSLPRDSSPVGHSLLPLLLCGFWMLGLFQERTLCRLVLVLQRSVDTVCLPRFILVPVYQSHSSDSLISYALARGSFLFFLHLFFFFLTSGANTTASILPTLSKFNNAIPPLASRG